MCLPHCLMYPFSSPIQRTSVSNSKNNYCWIYLSLITPEISKIYWFDLIYLNSFYYPYSSTFFFVIYFLYIINHVFVLINYSSLILYIYRSREKKNYFYFYYFINFLVHMQLHWRIWSNSKRDYIWKFNEW